VSSRSSTTFSWLSLVLTICINMTRGRGGHESPRWIRALGIGDGRTNRDLWVPPPKNTVFAWIILIHGRGPLAVLNSSTDDVSLLRPPYLCRWLCRTRSLPYWSHADTSPSTSEGSHAPTSFRDHTSGHREIETAHPLVTGSSLVTVWEETVWCLHIIIVIYI
jgi:hypothetical protein